MLVAYICRMEQIVADHAHHKPTSEFFDQGGNQHETMQQTHTQMLSLSQLVEVIQPYVGDAIDMEVDVSHALTSSEPGRLRFLSNHLVHGAISLWKIGAGPSMIRGKIQHGENAAW